MIHSIGLQAAQEQKSGKYDIRTRHRDEDGNPLFVNHLIKESSPYLLQHAHNPVKWRSWDEHSFQVAEEENKPILREKDTRILPCVFLLRMYRKWI